MIKNGVHIDGQIYQEDQDFPENQVVFGHAKGVQRQDLKGIAISGGGTRSAGLAAGQLRALRANGKFKDFQIVSMVSGGSWGAFPLFYLPSAKMIDTYLGQPLAPSQLTLPVIGEVDKQSVAGSISSAFLIWDALLHVLDGQQAYAEAIGQTFLAPLGLDEGLFFTWHAEQRDSILDMPNNSTLSSCDFMLALNSWDNGQSPPFPIVGGTLMRHEKGMNLHFEMTPLYTGVSGVFPKGGSLPPPPSDVPYGVGAGKTAPHLFGTDSPTAISATGTATARLPSIEKLFSLRDVIGISGCAPRALFSAPWFPNYDYWSPTYSVPSSQSYQKEIGYDFGDGGILDNYGIMPLLRRGCTRIIVFNNTEADIAQLNFDRWRKNQTVVDPFLDDALVPFFRPAQNSVQGNQPDQNIVFENVLRADGFTPLEFLVKRLNDLARQGQIAAVTDTYAVLSNSSYGIQGAFNTTVTWVFNCLPDEWKTALPSTTIGDPQNSWKKRGEKPFPFIKTFWDNPPFIVDLTKEEANMLGHLAWWVTDQLVNRSEI